MDRTYKNSSLGAGGVAGTARRRSFRQEPRRGGAGAPHVARGPSTCVPRGHVPAPARGGARDDARGTRGRLTSLREWRAGPHPDVAHGAG